MRGLGREARGGGARICVLRDTRARRRTRPPPRARPSTAGEPANIERHIDHAKYYMRVGQAGTQYSMSKGQTNIGHSLLSKTKY